MLGFATTRRHWFLRIVCAIVGVFWVTPGLAQITPDSTLPNNSNVRVQGNINLIEAGTTAGNNLFHSFREFSVSTGTEVHFNNGVDIRNIITRVTGKSVSNIDGLIKANGGANLFLINPLGIVFGENARLDIGGSFVGTTADAIGFDEDNFFSASDPQNDSSLLQINPNALFFNQLNSQASIQSNSTADVGLENILVPGIDSSFFTSRGLRVADGKSLLLVGGDININGSGLNALGGRIELGGLVGTGTVRLNVDGDNLSLSFPSGIERSDVAIANSAGVRVIADDGGSIAINARNLEIANESFLFAGIDTGNGSEQSKAGNIDINATGGIKLNDISFIKNYVLPGAKGQGGNTNISAKTLQVEGGAGISTRTFASGNGGKLTVQSEDIVLSGSNEDSFFVSRLFTGAQTNSSGNGGDLAVKTNSLTLLDGANMGVDTSGDGGGGNLTVEAQDIQVKDGGQVSASTSGEGKGGNITLKAQDIQVKDGGQVRASTSGEGKGGNIKVEAQDIQLIGKDFSLGGLFTRTDSTGDAGDSLNIKTNTLLVKDGAEVSASSVSQSSQSNAGLPGNITIEAEDIQVIGGRQDFIEGTKDFVPSGLFTTTESSVDAIVNLNIKTNTLLVKDGAEVSASTFGDGNGGNINVEAEDIQLIGESTNFFPSGFSTTSFSGGDAGDLNIKTNNLLVQDGADINASTFVGAGAGGDITVEAKNIQLIVGGIFSTAGENATGQENSTGNGGNLKINANTLLVKDGAEVSASTFGAGAGGDITVEAKNIQLIAGGIFTTGGGDATGEENPTGNGGNLKINANTLLVKDGAEVIASTFGAGAGGNINIEAQDIQLIDERKNGLPGGLFTTAEENSTGDGGDLSVDTNILQVENGARVSAEGLSTGRAGNLFINADSIRLNNNAQLNASTRSNKVAPEKQATININSKDLIMRRGSNIFTNAQGEKVQGGNINIDADIIAALENSDISANSANFRGGNVRIETQGLFGIQFRPQTTDFSDITATGASEDLSGNVEIINPDIDPNTGLVNLPTIPVETEVAQGCTAGSSIAKSKFEIIGRGGLPSNPTQVLRPDAVQVDLLTLKPEVNKTPTKKVNLKPNTSKSKKIVEATGWIQNKKGEIFFVADAPNAKQIDHWHKKTHCSG